MKQIWMKTLLSLFVLSSSIILLLITIQMLGATIKTLYDNPLCETKN